MINPKTTALLKATARERLLGNYGTLIGATLIYQIIVIFISNIVAMVVSPTNLVTYVVYFLAGFLVDLLLGIFMSGFAYLYMNLIYAQPVSVNDIFHGFTHNADKALILQIPFAIGSLLSSVFTLTLRLLTANGALNSAVIPVSAFGLGVLLVNLFIKLIFSQSYFLLQDFPDKSAADLLRISARMMKGNMLRLFVLYLSFVPLMLLGMVTLFVPLLWINVYALAANAAFYQDLIVNYHKNTGSN